jgi:uncharacterized alpha-E superfamily protein
MLGRTAAGVFWMFRHLERSENTARLLDAGFRTALTRSAAAESEWSSILASHGQRDAFLTRHDRFEAAAAIDFMLRDRANPSSVFRAVEAARTNGRGVRTALTREVWEAVNECWMTLRDALARPVRERDVPATLDLVKRQGSLVRGALHGTMMRNEIYDFARLGAFIERADNTARLLDVKYHVLLPLARAGGAGENAQWETLLRAVSALRAWRWLNDQEVSPRGVAHLMILDRRMPRSLAFCYGKIVDNLSWLAEDHGEASPALSQAREIRDGLAAGGIDRIFAEGLRDAISRFLVANAGLAAQIERDYRFYE